MSSYWNPKKKRSEKLLPEEEEGRKKRHTLLNDLPEEGRTPRTGSGFYHCLGAIVMIAILLTLLIGITCLILLWVLVARP